MKLIKGIGSSEGRGVAPRAVRRGGSASRWAKATLTGVTLAGLAGCGCKAALCRLTEVYKGAVAANYLSLCWLPESDRSAQLALIMMWQREMTSAFIAAATACEAGDDEWKSWRKWIQDHLNPNSILTTSGSGSGREMANSRPLFVTGETITLNATLTRAAAAKPITTVLIDGTNYLPEAAGKVAVESAATESGTSVVAISQVIKDSDTNAVYSYTYTVPTGTQAGFNMRGGSLSATLGGSISISDLTTDSSGNRSGLPTGLELTFATDTNKVHLSLDATQKDNRVTFDAAGAGWLKVGVIVTGSLPTEDVRLEDFKTLWISLPLSLSADGESLIIGSATPIKGLDFAPVHPTVAWAMASMDGQNTLPPFSDDPCNNLDNDSFPDGMELQVHLINCQLKANRCEGYENYEGCP